MQKYLEVPSKGLRLLRKGTLRKLKESGRTSCAVRSRPNTRMIEGYAEQRLAAEIPGFKMDAWLEELAERQGEVDGDPLDTLVAFAK